jgi:ABC-2 type transport system permease protein
MAQPVEASHTGAAKPLASSSNGGVASVIHDIGYQRYTGARLGRGYAVRSLYQLSLRSSASR